VRIRNDNGKVSIEVKIDPRYKISMIGRAKKNLKLYEELLKRNHGVDELILR
jgi:transcription antitermination factor NusA-like protein